MEGLPDFFRAAGSLPPGLDGALEDGEELDDATFGGGFDGPLDGLPAFFADAVGAAGVAAGAAADAEIDDLGGITGFTSGGE
jgi:hypothetical protein